jgi:hypothetical protein
MSKMRRDLVGDRDTNAKHWAEEFMSVIDGISKSEIDEGLMISWFASAIETTKDACWPGACVGCVYGEEDEDTLDIECQKGYSDPVAPFFFCANFSDKWKGDTNEEEGVVEEL